MKFVDITNDIAFRKIFGNETKKKSLISFLNAVIKLPNNEQVVDVNITDPYQLGRLSGGKSTIVDVKAIDSKGNFFIVEMQVADVEFFHKRILYYTSQSYVAQINKGEDYNRLKPVYFIGILEFEIAHNPNYFSKHKVLDVETNEHIIQDVEFNFIELPKFTKTLEQLETILDQWTYFIKNAENLTIIPESVTDEGLLEAYNEANQQNWTKKEEEDYMKASIKEGDEKNMITKAEKKGEKKGREEGERKKALEVAKSLIQNGISVEIIIQSTGLTEEEIKKL